MNGEYRVKNADLRELFDAAQELVRRFKSVRIQHVRREQNKRADELCNIALDGGKARAKKTPAKEMKDATSSKISAEGLREDCIACLAAARSAWSAHDADAPTPAQVWDQLWSILEESGALKKGAK
jgi:hypothetical protein